LNSVELNSYSLLAGLQFKLIDEVKMVISHSIPLDEASENNFQLNIRVPLSGMFGSKKVSQRATRRRIAHQQINQLNKGVLLVRLSNPTMKLEAMRRSGQDENAKKVEQRNKQQNKDLVEAFRNRYNFSLVYFFYSDHSRKVMKGERKGFFLNDSLEVDQAIEIPDSVQIFTLSLNFGDQDTSKRFLGYDNVSTGSFEEQRVPTYYGGSENSFQALLISDAQFDQLSRPFPYYSRYVGNYYIIERPDIWLSMPPPLAIFSGLTLEKSVIVLNSKLWRYWRRVNRITLDP
jgi:hypothetical protein